MTTVKSFDSIESMLDRFDFEKVQAIFALRGWSYATPSTPSIKELRDTARIVCQGAVRSAETDSFVHSECGRFLAIYSKQDGELSLNFIGESESAYV